MLYLLHIVRMDVCPGATCFLQSGGSNTPVDRMLVLVLVLVLLSFWFARSNRDSALCYRRVVNQVPGKAVRPINPANTDTLTRSWAESSTRTRWRQKPHQPTQTTPFHAT